MAEVLLEYSDVIVDGEGRRYLARACGVEVDNGMWHGWLEFLDADGGETLRSGRETTQPNRTDTVYWATGLTPVYLEGALGRARRPLTRPAASPRPQFDAPSAPAPDFADPSDPPPAESILNPFSVFRKGETLLRRQLGALSVWHLVNIVRAHGLSAQTSDALNRLDSDALIELIVDGVKTARPGERA